MPQEDSLRRIPPPYPSDLKGKIRHFIEGRSLASTYPENWPQSAPKEYMNLEGLNDQAILDAPHPFEERLENGEGLRLVSAVTEPRALPRLQQLIEQEEVQPTLATPRNERREPWPPMPERRSPATAGTEA